MTTDDHAAERGEPTAVRLLPDMRTGAAIFCLLLVVYNANGREIPSYDSQPTKFAARELLARGTLTLNYVVGAEPRLLERPAFVKGRDGRYRSAYSPVPALAAAAVAWPLHRIGLIDVQGPFGPQVIAVCAASVMTAAAVVLSFFTIRRRLSRRAAVAAALALGVGTGYWPTVSQTLWQHDTAALGLALAVLALTAMRDRAGVVAMILLGAGLALAITSRPQLVPAALVLLAGAASIAGPRAASVPAAIAGAALALLATFHMRWFGSPLGAVPLLEALHPTVHATERAFNPLAGGYLGLLVSPNRGLFIFSPVVAAALLGLRPERLPRWQSVSTWCGLAALVQYLAYGSYGVWWGGHTYGPRYMLDVLPLLVPLAANAIPSIRASRPRATLVAAAAAWSIAVAATGAFVYPDERWNVGPRDVDRYHERLWDWSDMQIVRAWHTGWNSRNFMLFDLASVLHPASPFALMSPNAPKRQAVNHEP